MTEPTPPAPNYQPQPYAPSAPYAPGPPTNSLAIISLVLSLVGVSLGGVICGHIALSQIRRTGEAGHGLALAGVIIGYAFIGIGVLFLIGYVVFFLIILGAAGAAGAAGVGGSFT
jgi:peptidyl-prolyl cis-trans isomerase B (cyclophilin B)